MRRRTLVSFLLLGLLQAGSLAAADPGPTRAALEHVAHAVFTDGNHVRLILDPEEAYRVRIEAVRSARHHILLSVPIWRTDEAGRRFLEEFTTIIEQKLARDPDFPVFVELDTVTFLPSHDWFGTIKHRLRSAGAKVRFFNPSTWVVTATYEARQHDKVLIVDGRLAILGGRNIGNEYFETGKHWTDIDAVVEGPAVQELQMMFLKTWTLMGRWNVLHNAVQPPERLLHQARLLWSTGHFSGKQFRRSPLDRYFDHGFFPPVRRWPDGETALVLWDNPLIYDRAPTLDVVLELIDTARHSLDIVTPYSTFPHELTEALVTAAKRGVRVRLVTSSRTHHNYGVDGWLATLDTLDRLATGGVTVLGWAPERTTVAEQCAPPFVPGILLHAKFLRVDERYALIHSSNFNYRSSYYNTEAGILVLGRRLARRLAGIVDRMEGSDGRSGACFPVAARREDPETLSRALAANRSRIESLEQWSFIQ